MKKIIIIDGGPRRAMNTARMLQQFAEGAKSVNDEIEIKSFRLYDLDYKGCMSCMACKVKGKAANICKFKDPLTPILEEIAQADGLVLGSPVYFGDVTGQMRTFLERRSGTTAMGSVPWSIASRFPLAPRNVLLPTTRIKSRTTTASNWPHSRNRPSNNGAMSIGTMIFRKPMPPVRKWPQEQLLTIDNQC